MTTIGLDVASVDDNKHIDWKAAYAAGGRFAILRGVYGRSVTPGLTAPFLDPMWTQEAGRARAAGFKVGAYLFVCVPKTGVYTPSPDDQADAFIGYVKLTTGVDLVPFFDVEEATSMLTADQHYAWILRVAKKLMAAYTAWPGMYSSARVWAELLGNHVAGELISCPLWIAKPWPYAVRSPVHLDGAPAWKPGTIPQFGNQCSLYQYQGDATGWPGFSSTVDADRFEPTARGASGEQVRWVQRRVHTDVDGAFGPKTEAAVKAFQVAHQLPPTGMVDLETFVPLAWVMPSS